MTDIDTIIYLLRMLYLTQTMLDILIVVVAVVFVVMFRYLLRMDKRIKALEQAKETPK